MIMVFNELDKEKLINKGYKFITIQSFNGIVGYLFQDDKNFNFENENMKYIKTNRMNF